MSRLEVLRRRQELVLRSAKLQRATIAIQLNRIEARPAMTLADSALRLLRAPMARRVAIAMLGLVLTRKRRRTR